MQTYATPGPVSLRLRLAAGSIRVEAVEGETTDVEVVPLRDDEQSRRILAEARIGVREHGAGHEVYVEVPQRRGWGFVREAQFEVVVRTPAGAEVDAETLSADVSGRGRFGALTAQTASGDVR